MRDQPLCLAAVRGHRHEVCACVLPGGWGVLLSPGRAAVPGAFHQPRSRARAPCPHSSPPYPLPSRSPHAQPQHLCAPGPALGALSGLWGSTKGPREGQGTGPAPAPHGTAPRAGPCLGSPSHSGDEQSRSSPHQHRALESCSASAAGGDDTFLHVARWGAGLHAALLGAIPILLGSFRGSVGCGAGRQPLAGTRQHQPCCTAAAELLAPCRAGCSLGAEPGWRAALMPSTPAGCERRRRGPGPGVRRELPEQLLECRRGEGDGRHPAQHGDGAANGKQHAGARRKQRRHGPGAARTGLRPQTKPLARARCQRP